ncbi:Protein N-acetyltransferase, RimJ/RimL family [Agreia bicolorata]|uniref:Protein N-acetyltransferase, RimJ/RimL family n=1 Tax=Agreia bicolorata TaxID=110935 RepID=A0A1T4XIB0_9MICO|nr:GNAT family protein [Agreia bicolorata]SKA89322.1 Protein N-acetyltransferase, RimJ/RimL family [Agreia bicolorata]
MPCTRPPYGDVIEGRFISLEPLTRQLVPELFAAVGHPEVFGGGYGGGPAAYRDTLEGFAEFAESYYAWDAANVHAVRLVGGQHDGLLVGTSTLGDFDLPLGYAHLGWTAYDPRVWGTAVNAEAKLLILGSAFDNGFERVKIQADVLNTRSRSAIAKLGATFEGVARHDMRRADGEWRDSAIFSILSDEWPTVRQGLERRIERQGEQPVELVSATQ